MLKVSANLTKIVLGAALIAGTPALALADCAEDIAKVETALGNADRQYEESQIETMSQLVTQAKQQHEAGNEEQCQETINQAMSLGEVQ
ncbi:hypothetical protein GR183_04630 [Stappia sp. GBMRC 2046]|uniref:Uncharacterized protein n=1 Tax=Stappia sediminis TaxID=2692190 RepID=A0A7X3LSA9_9HYPH|nr:hypothetical protein [Stappia sediminis]MXN64179.1 hypothetical protein [Stappia sediminis]